MFDLQLPEKRISNVSNACLGVVLDLFVGKIWHPVELSSLKYWNCEKKLSIIVNHRKKNLLLKKINENSTIIHVDVPF